MSASRAGAETVGRELGVDLRVVTLGPHCDHDDVLLRWNRLREIDDTGCILVRPDHHVAWRAPRLEPDAAGALGRAMRQVSARP